MDVNTTEDKDETNRRDRRGAEERRGEEWTAGHGPAHGSRGPQRTQAVRRARGLCSLGASRSTPREARVHSKRHSAVLGSSAISAFDFVIFVAGPFNILRG